MKYSVFVSDYISVIIGDLADTRQFVYYWTVEFRGDVDNGLRF